MYTNVTILVSIVNKYSVSSLFEKKIEREREKGSKKSKYPISRATSKRLEKSVANFVGVYVYRGHSVSGRKLCGSG